MSITCAAGAFLFDVKNVKLCFDDCSQHYEGDTAWCNIKKVTNNLRSNTVSEIKLHLCMKLVLNQHQESSISLSQVHVKHYIKIFRENTFKSRRLFTKNPWIAQLWNLNFSLLLIFSLMWILMWLNLVSAFLYFVYYILLRKEKIKVSGRTLVYWQHWCFYIYICIYFTSIYIFKKFNSAKLWF